MILYRYMNEENETTTPVNVTPINASQTKRRGRPVVNVNWPNADFTFNNLHEANKALSSSSLRKKMRLELTKGGLVKVGTLKTAFGRPQNIYSKKQ